MPSQSGPSEQEGVYRVAGVPDVVQGEVTVVGYDARGETVGADDPSALAKQSHDPATGVRRYWVKRATVGPDAGKMYNPESPTHGAVQTTVGRLTGRAKYEYRAASREAFELYVRFLESGNTRFIKQAERY